MTRTLSSSGAKRPARWSTDTLRKFVQRVRQGRIKGLKLGQDGKSIVIEHAEDIELKCSPGEKALVGKLKGHPKITNPYALAKWLRKHGKKGKKRKKK